MADARAALLSLATLATGCTTVGSSAYTTGPRLAPSASPVRVSATRDPAAGAELGAVEAHGHPPATLAALVEEFRGRVASLGGNYGRIDGFATRYEEVQEEYSYDCGTTETRYETRTDFRPGADGTSTIITETVPVTEYVPKTCHDTRWVEVATFTLTGRAFQVGEAP